MKCERCNNCDAVASITRVDENGNAETIRLGNCEACCQELRFLNIQSNLALDIQDVLQELIAQEVKGSAGTKIVVTSAQVVAEDDPECLHCGLKFSQYKKTLMLGCQYCYESFQNELEPRLKKYHRVSSHTGAGVVEASEAFEIMNELRDLKAALAEAVENEDYLHASELRKMIVRNEQKLEDLNTRATKKAMDKKALREAAEEEKALGGLKEVSEEGGVS
jgi:protein arginine kinase activator